MAFPRYQSFCENSRVFGAKVHCRSCTGFVPVFLVSYFFWGVCMYVCHLKLLGLHLTILFFRELVSVITSPPTTLNKIWGFDKRNSQEILHHPVLSLLGKVTQSFTPKYSHMSRLHSHLPEYRKISRRIIYVLVSCQGVIFQCLAVAVFRRKSSQEAAGNRCTLWDLACGFKHRPIFGRFRVRC